jgi:signal transduction histidine kinase
MLAKKLTGKGSAPYTLRLVSKEGQRHEVEVSSRLLYENGRATGVQGIARDLTERRRLEAELLQAQKMEAVGRLAGGIAHDFNNILMIVRGYAEILLERLHPEDPLHGQAAQIMKAGNRAAELTQRLLGFSRKQVFEPKILNVNEVVSEISKMLPTLLGAHVDFSLELNADAGNVNADPIQMEQVLINLAVNSRDAMPQGGKLIISTAARDLEGDTSGEQPAVLPGRYAEICVQDSGCGIDKETVRHIFEPFFTTKDKDKGTGLGLSTVYGIVKRSGGYILVSSEAGIGTTMRIYLPLVEREVESRTPDAEANGEMRGTGTVLIAEDEQARAGRRADARGRLRSAGSREWRRSPGDCGPLQRRHPIAAYRCDYAQAARAGIGVAVAAALSGDESDLHVGLHGKRAGAGRNAGAEHGAAAKAVHGEKNSGSDSTYECERTQLASDLLLAEHPAWRFPCAALQWHRMIDRLRRSSPWWIPKK